MKLKKKKIVARVNKTAANTTTLKEYAQALANIKQQINQAQIKATFAVNKELLILYWNIGKMIVQLQEEHGWGSKIIEQLAIDIQKAFPGLTGFSKANISYMHSFYKNYAILQMPSGKLEDIPIFNIPWWHNIVLISKIKDNEQRLWYAQKAVEHGWSRTILEMQIESNLFGRQGKAITNFQVTLPKPDSDMAQQSLKDPYIFDFLTLDEQHHERDIEQGLIENVQALLLELGKGFSFVARQYHLNVDNKDYYIDLLFYHIKLKRYIAIELKAKEFDPRDIGQTNFYLSAIDDLLKDENDHPTIGLILCKTKRNLSVEYALRGISRPLGVASYETEILTKLPKELKSTLPTIQEIEQELEKKELIQKLKLKKMKKAPRKAKKNESDTSSPRKHRRTKRSR